MKSVKTGRDSKRVAVRARGSKRPVRKGWGEDLEQLELGLGPPSVSRPAGVHA